MKLWRVVLPLHRPFECVALNYSKTIAGDHAGLVRIDKKDYKRSAANVLEKIRLHVEPLRQLQDPRDFLTYISRMSGNNMLNVRTDFALTHYLLGNAQEALRVFRQLDIDLNDYQEAVQKNSRPLFRQVLDVLENDPTSLRALIQSWRDQNIDKLGLSAAIAAPGLHLVQSFQSP